MSNCHSRIAGVGLNTPLPAVYYIIRSNERCASIMAPFETALKSHPSLSSES